MTTLSFITGVACSFAHDGSFAMSIGFIFGGVPVNVTFPVTVPPAASVSSRREGHRGERTQRDARERVFVFASEYHLQRERKRDVSWPPVSGPIGLSSPACVASHVFQSVASGVRSGCSVRR